MFNDGDVDLNLCCVSSHLPQQGRLQQEPVRCKISLECNAAAMQLHTPLAPDLPHRQGEPGGVEEVLQILQVTELLEHLGQEAKALCSLCTGL